MKAFGLFPGANCPRGIGQHSQSVRIPNGAQSVGFVLLTTDAMMSKGFAASVEVQISKDHGTTWLSAGISGTQGNPDLRGGGLIGGESGQISAYDNFELDAGDCLFSTFEKVNGAPLQPGWKIRMIVTCSDGNGNGPVYAAGAVVAFDSDGRDILFDPETVV